MLQLLKKMQRREVIMTLICAVFVVGQVYFDLRLPDYMMELTTLIKTSGTTADIVSVGIKMLGCTCVSAVLAVICGYLAARTASGFSYTIREKVFHHVMEIGADFAGDHRFGNDFDHRHHVQVAEIFYHQTEKSGRSEWICGGDVFRT